MVYNNTDSIEIIERDATGRKVSCWKFGIGNVKLANSTLGYIINKYGFKPVSSSMAEKDWLNMDVNL